MTTDKNNAAPDPQPAELAEQQVDALRERTPADFAIEHAGYLANASTRLLKACGELDSLVMRRDEHDDVDDSDMHAAQDRVDEASDSVRSAIYEFEKRRDRALAATGKQKVGESNQTTVDSGALRLALNVLRRAGKGEVAEALESTAARGQQVGEVQRDGLDVEWLKARVSSIHSTVSLGHQTGPHAYAGEDFGRYLAEAAGDCQEIMRALAARQPVHVQGSDELSARTDGERAAYLEGIEEGNAQAARQPGAQVPADLSQFRDAVFCMENYTGTLPRRYWDLGLTAFKAEAKRLRTLVESSGVIR